MDDVRADLHISENVPANFQTNFIWINCNEAGAPGPQHVQLAAPIVHNILVMLFVGLGFILKQPHVCSFLTKASLNICENMRGNFETEPNFEPTAHILGIYMITYSPEKFGKIC